MILGMCAFSQGEYIAIEFFFVSILLIGKDFFLFVLFILLL